MAKFSKRRKSVYICFLICCCIMDLFIPIWKKNDCLDRQGILGKIVIGTRCMEYLCYISLAGENLIYSFLALVMSVSVSFPPLWYLYFTIFSLSLITSDIKDKVFNTGHCGLWCFFIDVYCVLSVSAQYSTVDIII